MEWMHPKTSSQSSLFESTVNETCMVQKCTRALDCPWRGRWKPPGENCDLWMKLAHGMGTQIIWELKQRLKQDSCCLTCSLWTIHLDICFNLFSPVRLPTEGGGFLLACAEGPPQWAALNRSLLIVESMTHNCQLLRPLFFLLEWKPHGPYGLIPPSPASSFLLLVRTFGHKLSNTFIRGRERTRRKPRAGLELEK